MHILIIEEDAVKLIFLFYFVFTHQVRSNFKICYELAEFNQVCYDCGKSKKLRPLS